jgi:hypothetical protein
MQNVIQFGCKIKLRCDWWPYGQPGKGVHFAATQAKLKREALLIIDSLDIKDYMITSPFIFPARASL